MLGGGFERAPARRARIWDCVARTSSRIVGVGPDVLEAGMLVVVSGGLGTG